MSLLDADGFVGRGTGSSEHLGVQLESAGAALRLAKLLREWADFVEEQTQNPCSLDTWARLGTAAEPETIAEYGMPPAESKK